MFRSFLLTLQTKKFEDDSNFELSGLSLILHLNFFLENSFLYQVWQVSAFSEEILDSDCTCCAFLPHNLSFYHFYILSLLNHLIQYILCEKYN